MSEVVTKRKYTKKVKTEPVVVEPKEPTKVVSSKPLTHKEEQLIEIKKLYGIEGVKKLEKLYRKVNIRRHKKKLAAKVRRTQRSK